MRHPAAAIVALVAALAGVPALRAQDDASLQRQRIAAQRAEVQARYEEEAQRCRQRFAVNDCLDAARRQRRQALAVLQEQQFALDEAERARRAADREAAIARHQAEVAQRSAAAGSSAPAQDDVVRRMSIGPPDATAAPIHAPSADSASHAPRPETTPEPKVTKSQEAAQGPEPVAGGAASAPGARAAAPAPAAAAPRAARRAALSASQAAARAAAAEKRRAQIEQEQKRIQERLEKRAAKGRKAAPLPPPAAASASD